MWKTDLMFYILCGFLCYLSVARLWEFTREFTFQCVCVCLWALMSCCVYVNHTHPVCRATRLGTDALRLTPLSLPLSHSRSLCLRKNALCCQLKKSHFIHNSTCTWAFTGLVKKTKETFLNSSSYAGFLHVHLHRDTLFPTCLLCETRSWPAMMNKNPICFPFGDTELGQRKWKLVCLGEGRYYSNMQ